jgi:hypothetical protein
VALAVALVVLLPNKVVVHWGAASSVDGSSSSSQCAFPLFLFPFFSCFLSLLLLLLFSVFFLFLLFVFFSQFSPPYLSLFFFILSFPSFFFLYVFHLQNSQVLNCKF